MPPAFTNTFEHDRNSTSAACNHLKNIEQHFRTLYEESPIPYQSLDSDGHLTEINKAWLEVLGYKRNKVIVRWVGNLLGTIVNEFKRHNR